MLMIKINAESNGYDIVFLQEKIHIKVDEILNEEEIIDFLIKITKMNGNKFLELEAKNDLVQDKSYNEIYELFKNFVKNYNKHFKFTKNKIL